MGDHHAKLLANCFAQTEALMRGRTEEEAREGMLAAGPGPAEAERWRRSASSTATGPTSTILMDKVTPRTLGALIALYEHKIFTQGIVWGINSFDQWGVELGKQLAGVILGEIERSSRAPPPWGCRSHRCPDARPGCYRS
jgi:glucose-6-phosphate isomerase